MKGRWILVGRLLLVLAFGAFLYPTLRQAPVSDVPFDQAVAGAVANIDMSVYPQQDQQAIRRWLGADPSEYVNMAFYRLPDNMSAAELVIAEYADPGMASKFADTMAARRDAQHAIYAGYAPEQTAQMEKARIEAWGNYGIYVVGDQADQVVSQLQESLGV